VHLEYLVDLEYIKTAKEGVSNAAPKPPRAQATKPNTELFSSKAMKIATKRYHQPPIAVKTINGTINKAKNMIVP
jgi:hypothetical protein